MCDGFLIRQENCLSLFELLNSYITPSCTESVLHTKCIVSNVMQTKRISIVRWQNLIQIKATSIIYLTRVPTDDESWMQLPSDPTNIVMDRVFAVPVLHYAYAHVDDGLASTVFGVDD